MRVAKVQALSPINPLVSILGFVNVELLQKGIGSGFDENGIEEILSQESLVDRGLEELQE